MQIEPASLNDIPTLCELLNSLFTLEAEFTPDKAAQYRGLRMIIGNPEVGTILVARLNGHPIGMVTLLYSVSTALGERVGLLEDMIVDPGHRATGVGSQLLETALNYATANGCKRITLLTDAENTNAQRFYQRHGFSRSSMVPLRLCLA